MKFNKSGNKKMKNIVISIMTIGIIIINLVLISSVFGNDVPLNLLDKLLIASNSNNNNANRDTDFVDNEYNELMKSGSKETITELVSTSESEKAEIFELAKPISNSLGSNESEKVIETEASTETLSADTIIYAESIIQAVRDCNLSNGNYTIRVTTTTETVDYLIELWNEYNDVTYTTNTSLGNTTAGQRMLIVKYHKNLTINSGVTVTARTRKKGMFLYVAGELVNRGEITMTARGTSATGQNVYLWKNSNNSYETVPAIGGAGLGSVILGMTGGAVYNANGNNGSTVSNRATGGGGRGATRDGNNINGAGRNTKLGITSAGTSYAGGSGSAGARVRDITEDKSSDASVSFGNGSQGGSRL